MKYFYKNVFYSFYFLSGVIFDCETAGNSQGDIVFKIPTVSGMKVERMCNEYTTQACNGILSRRQIRSHHTRSVPYEAEDTRQFQDTKERLLKSKRSALETNKNGSTEAEPGTGMPHFVVGGRASKPKEYPHMALIGYEAGWLCGGTLISENFVLSAAHCTSSNEGNPKRIRLGELNWMIVSDDAKVLDFNITEIIVHPGYKSPVLYNDIALFKFQGVRSFSDYIRPICLHVLQDLPNQKVTVAGWGSTGYGETSSKQLLSVEFNIQKSQKCDLLYRGAKLPNGFDANSQICAGYAEGGRDSCQGDSGGPLQMVNYRAACTTIPIYKQVGIVSFGENCGLADTPGVYTRVSYFIPWIESIVWK